jgi:Ca2+-binding EF-hand superfamily protein
MARMEKAIAELRVTFNSFDKDNNGVLTKKEIKDVLKKLRKDATSAQVDRVFNAIDVNNDGEITFDGKSILS